MFAYIFYSWTTWMEMVFSKTLRKICNTFFLSKFFILRHFIFFPMLLLLFLWKNQKLWLKKCEEALHFNNMFTSVFFFLCVLLCFFTTVTANSDADSLWYFFVCLFFFEYSANRPNHSSSFFFNFSRRYFLFFIKGKN